VREGFVRDFFMSERGIPERWIPERDQTGFRECKTRMRERDEGFRETRMRYLGFWLLGFKRARREKLYTYLSME
jgi:hypothetical protein